MPDLLDPFWTCELFGTFCKNLIERNDPAVTLLALEGFYRIESEVKSRQCNDTEGIDRIKVFLNTLPNELEMVFSRLFPRQANEIAQNLTFITRDDLERPEDSSSTNNRELRPEDSPSTDDREFYSYLIEEYDTPVALLALEGLFRIQSGQITDTERNDIKNVLRILRNKMLMGYKDPCNRAKAILRNLTIFKELEVPLFIDDYGKKELMSSFEATEAITIDEDTPIFHVTHRVDAQSIKNEKRIKGSDNKNSIKGCWFGLDNPRKEGSVYGSRAFRTNLARLGVTGLRQGEIVSYKNEVNVILYAYRVERNKPVDFKVSKPTDDAAKKRMNPNAYVKVSIFVPEEFLPEPDRFSEVIDGLIKVKHESFCVTAKRSRTKICPDITEEIGELNIGSDETAA